jgi:glycosyltransferase involved in cell wall biosynthesis
MNLCVILLTYNESANINACLDSLAGLDAGIFAVDSFSTDNTVDLLEKRGIAYVQHPFENYARQRNWAQENCPFPAAWVLHLDAGERLSPELTDWLRHHFDPNTPASGYLFSRRTIFMDRWIRHGGHYPNYHLRLFRRDRGHCEAKAYDQHFLCGGLVLKAPWKADLIDIVSSNLVDFTNSHTRWALLEAVERISQPHDTGEVTPRFWGTPIERRRWWENGIV